MEHIRLMESERKDLVEELIKHKTVISGLASLLNPYIKHKGPTIYG
jgi:hypothetical protein